MSFPRCGNLTGLILRAEVSRLRFLPSSVLKRTVTGQCYVGPCHHGMAHPRVADGEDGLQIKGEAVNILNRQLRTADEGWSSVWGLGYWLTAHRNKKFVTKCYTGLPV